MGSTRNRENHRATVRQARDAEQGRRAPAPCAFTLLPEGESRLGAFLAGVALEFGIALLVVALAAILPRPLVPATRLSLMPLFVAPVTDWRPPAPKVPIVLPRVVPRFVPAKGPVLEPKRVRVAEAPAVTPEFRPPAYQPAPPRANDLPRPRPGIRTGVLPGSVATPTLPRAPARIQTGGFGDPQGVPATGDARRPANINPVGSFAMAVGPGEGNGTSGSRGARSVIASAGFGNGVASPGEGGAGPARGAIRSGVFTDGRAAPASRPAAPPAKPSAEPVEILEKPDPVYTAEARALRIEGDVLLDVVFTAAGSVEVLRVVRGLGHGLDQAAIAAAERIRFRPGRIAGKPVDSQARLRIVFRLAY
jgi:TonB family protein